MYKRQGALVTGFRLWSSEFENGGTIPQKYTADGDNISPPLGILDAPENTVSFALIMDDPDAPGGTFTHWLFWNIPGSVVQIPEHVQNSENVPLWDGTARQGINDFGRIGYSGPDPPSGAPHRYRFTVFALDTSLGLAGGAAQSELEAAMEGHILAQFTLTGLYGR